MPTLVRDQKQVNRSVNRRSIPIAQCEAWGVLIVEPTGKFGPKSPTAVPRSFKPMRRNETGLSRNGALSLQAAYNAQAMKCRWKTWAIVRVDRKLAEAQQQAAALSRDLKRGGVDHELLISVHRIRSGRIDVMASVESDFQLEPGSMANQVMRSIRKTVALIEKSIRPRRKSA